MGSSVLHSMRTKAACIHSGYHQIACSASLRSTDHPCHWHFAANTVPVQKQVRVGVAVSPCNCSTDAELLLLACSVFLLEPVDIFQLMHLAACTMVD